MLYLGEDDFRKGLKMYFTKHAYRNTTGDDLWAALSEASGKDVGAFMNPWIMRPGYPVVEVRQTGTMLQVHQTQFLLDPSKADAARTWPVPLLASSTQVPALLETAELAVTLGAPDYVSVNQGAIGHYIVRYAEPEHAAYIAGLVDDKTPTIAERLMLLSDSTQLSRSGRQPFSDTLKLLEHYKNEDTDSVWDIMALILADARRFIDSNLELEPKIKALVRTLIETQYQRLGWEEKPGEPSDDTKLRASIIGLGSYAEHPEIVKHALELFEAYKSNPEIVASELRGIVFSVAVREAVPGTVDYLLNTEEATSNVNLKDDILGALTATRSEAEARMFLARLKDPNKVRQNVVDYWLVFLLRNRYTRQVAWDWFRDNWDWLEKTFKDDSTYDGLPRYAASAFNTREYMEQYIAFFEPLKAQVALEHNIAMGIEELHNRIAWLERDIKGVEAYFGL